MLESSAAYRAAITGDVRRMLLRAVIDIVDPDVQYGDLEAESQAAWSMPEQVHDKIFSLDPYSTLERGRWLLNGMFRLIPDDKSQITGQMGPVSRRLSGDDGVFPVAQYFEQPLSNVSILQACSVYFSAAAYDGIPVDFTVEVKQGGTAYFTKAVTDNQETKISLDGFTVQNPDAIRITVTRWSLPGRRMRIPEIVPGIYEIWDSDMIAAFSVSQQANVSCLSLPYCTCTLSMDNKDRRFEPRSKSGIFKSIEERQSIPVSIGVELPDGSEEYKQVGVFYQFSGGWKTGDNGLSMTWSLVDIVGLLADREFLPPDTLPTTLDGWIAALAAQLGPNFTTRYHVDPNYAALPVTASSASDVTGKKCGEILRWACMATGTWPRADAETGDLTVEPFWSQGNLLDLDNMTVYPVMKANDDIGAIIFTLADGNQTKLVVSGTSTASSETKSVSNPFIHTQEQALTAARLILSTYGGNKLEATGRGDPSSELGDVVTVQLDESSATTGRLIAQTLSFASGVLQNCQSTLLQADGSFAYQERVVLTGNGEWTAPANVKDNRLRAIVVQAGGGGTPGTDGTFYETGQDGEDGLGGKVWAGTISINPQQLFAYSCGKGGEIGQEGGETTFGQYTSAQGTRFDPSYTDVASGDAYARTGTQKPVDGTGDGGAKGLGGNKGERHRETTYDKDGNPIGSHMVVDVEPGIGTPGTAGADGVIVVYWDKAD